MFQVSTSKAPLVWFLILVITSPALATVELWVSAGVPFRYTWPEGDFIGAVAHGDRGITLGPDGNVYIADADPGAVHRYLQDGTYVGEFVATGSAGLYGATGIAFGPDGNLYVASAGTAEVLRYNGQSGAFIDVFCTGSLTYPQSIRFGPDGNLYVTSSDDAIVRFDGQNGQFLDVFASGGELDDPMDMVFGADGLLYVSNEATNNPGNGNVVRFDPVTGQSLGEFVTAGSSELYWADGMAFGPDGDLYVADSVLGTVRRYDGQTGAYIDNFTGYGLDQASFIAFVPEPGSLVLLGASCVVLLRRRG